MPSTCSGASGLPKNVSRAIPPRLSPPPHAVPSIAPANTTDRPDVATARPAASARDVRLTWNLDDRATMVEADPNRMQQVIGNLLDRVDAICIGGAMAFTLLVARGEDGLREAEKENWDFFLKLPELDRTKLTPGQASASSAAPAICGANTCRSTAQPYSCTSL